jgi:hypothetical protein
VRVAIAPECLYIARMHPDAQALLLSTGTLPAGLLLRPRGA